jgi:hypothetical protein
VSCARRPNLFPLLSLLSVVQPLWNAIPSICCLSSLLPLPLSPLLLLQQHIASSSHTSISPHFILHGTDHGITLLATTAPVSVRCINPLRIRGYQMSVSWLSSLRTHPLCRPSPPSFPYLCGVPCLAHSCDILLLSAVYCLLSTVCCLLSAVCRLLSDLPISMASLPPGPPPRLSGVFSHVSAV